MRHRQLSPQQPGGAGGRVRGRSTASGLLPGVAEALRSCAPGMQEHAVRIRRTWSSLDRDAGRAGRSAGRRVCSSSAVRTGRWLGSALGFRAAVDGRTWLPADRARPGHGRKAACVVARAAAPAATSQASFPGASGERRTGRQCRDSARLAAQRLSAPAGVRWKIWRERPGVGEVIVAEMSENAVCARDLSMRSGARYMRGSRARGSLRARTTP